MSYKETRIPEDTIIGLKEFIRQGTLKKDMAEYYDVSPSTITRRVAQVVARTGRFPDLVDKINFAEELKKRQYKNNICKKLNSLDFSTLDYETLLNVYRILNEPVKYEFGIE